MTNRSSNEATQHHHQHYYKQRDMTMQTTTQTKTHHKRAKGATPPPVLARLLAAAREMAEASTEAANYLVRERGSGASVEAMCAIEWQEKQFLDVIEELPVEDFIH